MKKIFLLAAFAAATLSASAQQTQKMPRDRQEMRADMTPEQRADRQAKMMQKQLSLTDDQAMRVRDINLKFMPSMKDREDRKARMQEMGQMMKERDAAYGQVLKPDQMALYKKMKTDRKENMKMRRDIMEKARVNKGDMQDVQKTK